VKENTLHGFFYVGEISYQTNSQDNAKHLSVELKILIHEEEE